MKKILNFAILMALLLSAGSVWSQSAQDTTDKFICIYRADMETYCPGLLADLEKRYGPSLGVNPDKTSATHIAGLSREIGTAVNEALESITNRSEQIANTGVGKFTLAMIAYKVMGRTLVRLLVGLPILILIIFIFVKWWGKIGVPQLSQKPDKSNPGQYKCEIEYPKIGEQLLWGCVFLVIIWISLGVIV